MNEQMKNFTDARTLPKAYNEKNLILLKDAVKFLLALVPIPKKTGVCGKNLIEI